MGFDQKQKDVRAQEQENAKHVLLAQESRELDATVKERVSLVEQLRIIMDREARQAMQHDRTTAQLESLKVRPGLPASAIIRNTVGPVRRGEGVSECGRRQDIALESILLDNPATMRRAQLHRRGRVGETNQARDMATEGWMRLARAE